MKFIIKVALFLFIFIGIPFSNSFLLFGNNGKSNADAHDSSIEGHGNSIKAHGNGTVAQRNGTVAQRNGTVAQRNGTIAQRNGTIAQRNGTVAQRNGTVAQCNGTVAQRNGTVAQRNSTVAQSNGTVAQSNSTVAQGNSTVAQGNSTVAQGNSTETYEEQTATTREEDREDSASSELEIEDQYFEHRLDNFDELQSNPNWYQKYWIDDSYYEEGGPVYLMLADRALLNKTAMSGGYWFKHGKEKKALFLYITHRFYDKSNENRSLSASTTSMGRLSAQQAVADYVKFIKYINEKHELPEDTKWIVFGSSYAGNLAAWLRAQNPDLVHAAVASSAPVLAKMDIPEYLDNVGNTLAKYNSKCKNDISLASKDLDKMVVSTKGRKQIGQIFKLCQPLNGDSQNISFFATNTVKYISDAVQYDLGSAKVKKICDKMLKNKSKKPIQRYAEVIHMLMGEQNQTCLSTNFATHLKFLQSDNASHALVSGRIWLYQQCHEFGWFPTSSQKSKVFSKNVNLNYFIDLCAKVFELPIDKKSISEAVDRTNKAFKGLTLNTPRTLLVNGDVDPWKFAQITSNKDNKNLDIITIKKGSHCSDIHYADANKIEIVNAIKEIEKKLDSYLNN